MSLEPHYASEAAAAPSEVIDSASEGGAPCFSRQHNDPHDLWGLQGHWDPVTVISGTLFLHPSVAQKGTETARQLERSNSNSDVPSRRAKGWTSIGRAPATEAGSGSEPRRSVKAPAPATSPHSPSPSSSPALAACPHSRPLS